ncbi:CRTAC1 family protein [Hoeflea sp.]|uniref:CRTAC1 family protein n=1 Tax=Hoeflea sp. TaxID=1940281 RepID=UPI003B019465
MEAVEPAGRPDAIVSEDVHGNTIKLKGFLPPDQTQCNSAGAGDFDNDGDLDVYLACAGSVRNRLDRLYVNDAGRKLTLMRNGVTSRVVRRGVGDNVSIADYDNDGRLDIYVANGYGPPFLIHGRRQLLRNVTENDNHWIKFELVGTQDNRDGVGSRVFAKAGDRFQVRYQTGGVRSGVQDSKILHFGLGDAKTVDEIIVQWPNGSVELFGPVEADAQYELVQGDGVKTDTAKLPVN